MAVTESILHLAPRLVATGAPEGDALENIITFELSDGALCYVTSGPGQGLWELEKHSTLTPDGTTIVEPIAGPGRWIKKIALGVPSTVSGVTAAANVGAGTGMIFRDIVLGTLNLRTLAALGSMVVTTVGDVVNIDGSALLPRDGSRPMTGDLNMGGHNLISASPIKVQGFSFPVPGASFFLPAVDGTPGQVLTTNGAGVLTFTTVSGSGGLTTGANVGAGAGQVFRDVTGTTLNLRTIAGINSITTATVGDVINVDGNLLLPRDGSRPMTGDLNMGGNDILSASPLAVQGFIFPVPGAIFTLPAADGTPGQVLTTNGAGILTFASSTGITNALNVGAGLGQVFRDITGTTINLRTIAGINSIVTATVGDVINVDGNALLPRDGSRPMTGSLNMGGNAITSVSLLANTGTLTVQSVAFPTGGASFTWPSAAGAAGSVLTTNGPSGILSFQPLPASVTAGANVGAGLGQVFRDITGSTINLRTIAGINSIVTATVGDVINVDGTALLPRDGSRPMTGDLNMGGNDIVSASPLAVQGFIFPVAGAVFTLPAADGTSGQFLQTNGAGLLTFASATTAVANVGGAADVFRDITAGTINLRTLAGINSITTAVAGDVVNINGSALLPRDGSRAMLANLSMGGFSVTNAAALTNPTSLKVQNYTFPNGGSAFTMPSADGPNLSVLTTNGAGVLSFQPLPASVTAGANVGVGTGTVFRDITSGTINLRTIAGINGIGVTTAGDVISINGIALLPVDGSRPMTGTLDMSQHPIINPTTITNASAIIRVQGFTFPISGPVFTLPAADGGNGTVLTTNGSGVLSFQPVAAGQTMTVAPSTIAVSQTLADPGANHVLYKVNTSSTITINLPLAPTANAKLTIKDFTGPGAATNNITIAPSGGQTIEGVAGNQIIATIRGAISLIWSATDNTWIIWN